MSMATSFLARVSTAARERILRSLVEAEARADAKLADLRERRDRIDLHLRQDAP